MNDQFLAVERGECARPGLKAAPAILQFRRPVRGKVHAPVFAIQNRSKCRCRVVLRPWLDASIGQACQRLHHQRRAAPSQLIEQLHRGQLRSDAEGPLQQDWAGVEAFFQQHGGVAGEDIAVGHGPLNRRGATVAGQQGGVQVDAAQPRQRQHPWRNQTSVGHDNDGVRGKVFQLRAKLLVVSNLFRLHDRKACFQRGQLNGRSGELAISTHGPVGLCDHERDLMFRRAQRFQRLYCKARSPAENQLHLSTTCLHAASCESCAGSSRA